MTARRPIRPILSFYLEKRGSIVDPTVFLEIFREFFQTELQTAVERLWKTTQLKPTDLVNLLRLV